MCKMKTHTHSEYLCPEKKGQNNALINFHMQAILEGIGIVVFLFISTKAADRLPRDPKENCLRGRQKLSMSRCKDLSVEENILSKQS